MFKLHQETNI